MTFYIDIQNTLPDALPVTDEELTRFAEMALDGRLPSAELTIRLVSPDEMIHLNHTYRKKNAPTNVLSFPFSLPEVVELECPLLGDVIICPEVLDREHQEQHKTVKEHWALIVIHGVLHLIGYDHIRDDDAKIMQGIEIQLLERLGYDNPYLNEEDQVE